MRVACYKLREIKEVNTMQEAMELARKLCTNVIDAYFMVECKSNKKYLVVTRGVEVKFELNERNEPKMPRRIKK